MYGLRDKPHQLKGNSGPGQDRKPGVLRPQNLVTRAWSRAVRKATEIMQAHSTRPSTIPRRLGSRGGDVLRRLRAVSLPR